MISEINSSEKSITATGIKSALYKAMPMLILVLFAALICSILEGYMSLVMMDSIDTVKAKDMLAFKNDVFKLLLIAVASMPATVLLAYTRGLYKRKSIVSVKVNFIKGVFQKNINEFQRDNTSKYVSALTNDINTIENNYIDGIYGITVSAVSFAVGILIIGFVSPIALGLGIGISIASTLISIFLSKPVQKHQVQRSELYEGYTNYIKEVLSAFHIIKSNNLNEKVQYDFKQKSSAIQHKGYIIDKISTFIFSLQHITMNTTFVTMNGAIVFLAIKGNLTLGGAVLVLTNIEKVIRPLVELSECLPRLLSTKKLFIKVEDTLKNLDNYEETVDIKNLRNAIEFDKVSFAYDKTPVLRDVSLKIEKGGKYLIIGPSGGGKSTLLKLLRKYYSPISGTISIDGKNMKDVTKDSYFHNISNIEQQVFLFEDSVRNNICLYKKYSDEELNEAIEKAGLSDFIAGLTDGLDTIIYDNGRNVSGGEKSRIAIARGLLQKADIIFLDEAFASLDSRIAREIEKTILGLENITVVNVSHVIFDDTKKAYDKVLMVKNKNVLAV